MSQYAKLLLITDTTKETTPAFQRAVYLARATGAQLHVLVFCNDPMIDALGSVNAPLMERTRKAYMDEQQQAMHALTDPLVGEGIVTYLELVWEPPFADVVLSRIVALQPDLVVKDVQPEPLLQRILLGGLDWDLVNHTGAPLLFVNRHASQLPSRVLAAVDTGYGSGGLNEDIVKAALALALQCDADAQLLHVTNYRGPVTDSTLMGDSGLVYQELMRVDHEQFEALADRFDVPPERRHVLNGTVPQALAEFARDPLGDVLVIGAAYRSRLERLLLGRTAQSILQKVHCDVLVVRPPAAGAGAEDSLPEGPGRFRRTRANAPASRPSA